MATYKYSLTPTGTIFGTTAGFPAFTTTDIFSIDDDSVSASSITSVTQAGTTTTITFAAKTISFTGFTQDTIAKTNFIFADGSQLIIGDGTATGGANDTGNNTLVSTDFNDYIDGMGGSDTVSYVNASSAVTVYLGTLNTTTGAITGTAPTTAVAQDTIGAGTDKLVNIENVTGSDYNDTLYGNNNDNVIDGGAGVDTLSGFNGNDTYYVTAGDTIVESTATTGGIDTVISNGDYVLANGLENLTLSGTAITGIGNSVANTIIGNASNNVLDGKGGADILRGLAGDDTYFVDSTSDTVDETIAGSAGTDLVIASANFTLSNNVENLRLMATTGTAITGAGNALNNIVYAGNGNDTMDGGTGTDTLSYQYATGKVTATLGSSETSGTSTAASGNTVGSGTDSNVNFENLTGGSYADTLTGNSTANTITGGLGNDNLIGVGANDTLVGGLGNDTYTVDSTTGYTITEAAAAGTDTVIYTGTTASSTFDISALTNVENLTMGGHANINGTGNVLANVLTGNDGGNTLSGGAGDDQLYDGGNITAAPSRVVDSLIGGLGNDTYYVNSSDTAITEASGQGTDLVISTVNYSLNDASSIGVENLTLQSGAGNINGTGNSLANIITGNAGNNILTGGAGADTLIGGLGDDTYVVDAADSVVEATGEGTDVIQSSVTYALNDVAGAGIDNLTLTGTGAINGSGNSLGNIITGNTSDNTLTGGAGVDTLIGGDGNDALIGGISTTTGDGVADTMIGGNGNDTYYVTDTSDTVSEASSQGSTDLVSSTVDYALNDNTSVGVEGLTLTGALAITATGNSLANTITGNSANNFLNGGAGNDTLVDAVGGNDTLDGGTGADSMSGGAGNDTYIVDNIGDTVTEATNGGTDIVQASVTYTISDADVENLTLTGTGNIDGTGNASANIIVGNAGNNTLNGGDGVDTLSGGDGNDSLIGGTGIDGMSGGAGNDTYSVDNTSDTVTEASGAGIDLIQSTVTYTLNDTFGIGVDNLQLTGATTGLTATGNTLANVITANDGGATLKGLAGDDTLNGGALADTLDGGTGADAMSGGAGNDTYIVDNSGDTVTEASGNGTDSVQSSVTFTLGANIENLTLTGTAAIDGAGNSSNNTLIGNSATNMLTGGDGNDYLDGKAGNDVLIGGNGSDTYVVDSASDLVDETTGTTGTDAVAATTVNAGADLVQSSVTYTIADVLVENLTLTGTGAVNGTGNSSANILTGNGGSNILNGAEGDDLINGGAGKDTLTGGTGADTFVFSNSTDSGLTTFDIINDFSQGSLADKIDLSGIDAGTLAAPTLVASTVTTVSAAHAVNYFVSGANTFIIADTDGVASTIDFKVELLSFTGTLTASDFIL